MSQQESARKETVFTKASEGGVDLLSLALFGVPRPSSYSATAWARVLKAFVYQPRGTFPSLFSVLDALFYDFTLLTRLSVTVSNYSVNHADITDGHAQRFARFTATNGQKTIVWVQDANSGTATLSPISTAYTGTIENGSGTLDFLPFILFEGLNEITFLLDSELLSPPPTYLQDQSGARPTGQPNGGHLLNLFDLDPDTLDYGDQNVGPYPLYLDSFEVGGILSNLLPRLLKAGTRFTAKGHSWGPNRLGYGGLYALPVYGSVGPV